MKKVLIMASVFSAAVCLAACDSGTEGTDNYDNNLDEGMAPNVQEDVPETIDYDTSTVNTDTTGAIE
ncbi:MAG: hypothetical protein LPJ89_03430 [Hymenobacteraceae bacterium]|nr:hypothetical protein [Hymenobacteraceae bacterium]MDX5396129.1 hypothetical protein [Hymenobacteraceae bacterium]MDX5442815.1 hypothetical protein [Hymenobacteraceae bacterium]MDX5512190.1 hypothetical protein [Hymenobacteraceae bacterium]